MPDPQAAHYVTYYRCACGCDQLVLRLHDERDDVFATAVFDEAEARTVGLRLLSMFPTGAIGKVAGRA